VLAVTGGGVANSFEGPALGDAMDSFVGFANSVNHRYQLDALFGADGE
jgi:hypothetical protein